MARVKQYWLIKSEPDVYSFDTLVADQSTAWTGVRNYAARINLNAMKKGDECLYYHSNMGKAIVGIAKVVKEAYPDPTAAEPGWVCVDVAAVKPLKNPVTLEAIKAHTGLQQMALVRLSRLSVQPVLPEEFDEVMRMSKSSK